MARVAERDTPAPQCTSTAAGRQGGEGVRASRWIGLGVHTRSSSRHSFNARPHSPQRIAARRSASQRGAARTPLGGPLVFYELIGGLEGAGDVCRVDVRQLDLVVRVPVCVCVDG